MSQSEEMEPGIDRDRMTGPRSHAGLVLLLILLCVGCSEPEESVVEARPVRAIKVGDITWIKGREFPGRANAKNEVDLSFQVAGSLISLPVDVGSQVQKGDVVGVIDPRDFEAALASAEGNLARAKANLAAMEAGARAEELEQLKASVSEAEATHKEAIGEHDRYKRLLDQGAATQQQFDIALARRDRTAAQLTSAKEALNIGMTGARQEDLDAKRSEIRALEAAVKSASIQLEYTVLNAPFSGEVAARYVDNFQTVQAKQPVVRLLDISTVEVTVQIPERVISLIPLVKQVSCRFDVFGDREFVGSVTKIGSEASQTTRTYPVTIEIPQPDDVRILPGMAARVRNKPEENQEESDDHLVVPPTAVFSGEAGEQSYVWIIEEPANTVARREVTVGELTPVGLAISDGLSRGEWVVTAGVNSLQDDQTVTILQEKGSN